MSAGRAGYALTNAQAALMAAVEIEKNSGYDYRRIGQMDAVIVHRASVFLRFLEPRSPSASAEQPGGLA